MSDYTPLAPEMRASPAELYQAADRAFALIDLLHMAADHPDRDLDGETCCHVLHLLRGHLDFIVSARLAPYDDMPFDEPDGAVPFDVDDVDD